MIALIAITTFILLARAFRSLLLPAKAILLNILSVAAGWGAMVLVWQQGYGPSRSGASRRPARSSWVPLITFAFLYGLSMDYEAFILSRMREEYDRTGSTDAAVIRGIGRTGRLVTSAALILFLAFVAMASDRARAEDGRHRARDRHPARRDRDPGADRPRGDLAHTLELVASPLAGAPATRGALAAATCCGGEGET